MHLLGLPDEPAPLNSHHVLALPTAACALYPQEQKQDRGHRREDSLPVTTALSTSHIEDHEQMQGHSHRSDGKQEHVPALQKGLGNKCQADVVSKMAANGASRLHGFAPRFARVPPPRMQRIAAERAPLQPSLPPTLLWDDSAEVLPACLQSMQRLLLEAQSRALHPTQHKEFLLTLVRSNVEARCSCDS